MAQAGLPDWQQAIEQIKPKLIILIRLRKVFTDAALRKLYHRADIHVIIDDLKSELQRIHQIISSPGSLRQHFLMDEKGSGQCVAPKCDDFNCYRKRNIFIDMRYNWEARIGSQFLSLSTWLAQDFLQ